MGSHVTDEKVEAERWEGACLRLSAEAVSGPVPASSCCARAPGEPGRPVKKALPLDPAAFPTGT